MIKLCIQLILGFIFTLYTISGFSVSETETVNQNKDVTEVEFLTIGCKVFLYPAPNSVFVDCTSYGKDKNNYGGQRGFISNANHVATMVVEIYNKNGKSKGRRFLMNPPGSLDRYVQYAFIQDPWVLEHEELRSIIKKEDKVKVKGFGFSNSEQIKIYADPNLQVQKDGFLNSKVVNDSGNELECYYPDRQTVLIKKAKQYVKNECDNFAFCIGRVVCIYHKKQRTINAVCRSIDGHSCPSARFCAKETSQFRLPMKKNLINKISDEICSYQRGSSITLLMLKDECGRKMCRGQINCSDSVKDYEDVFCPANAIGECPAPYQCAKETVDYKMQPLRMNNNVEKTE